MLQPISMGQEYLGALYGLCPSGQQQAFAEKARLGDRAIITDVF